ncbi:hypothetical protein FRC03_004800 [Tulasnella sp. 419]|nr:hypothetical protein FRC03_004800 [Tulasnella sp. 419]
MASLPEGDEDEDHRDIMHQICEILGTIVLLMYPLSSRSLERLLGWDEETVEPALGPFHSVLSIPPEPTPIRVFHKSFPDFLTDKQRSAEFWFHIESTEHHARLALLCLTHMNSALRRDMCGVGNQLVSEIDDVETMLQTKVEQHVLYACRHWARHLTETTWTEKVEGALKNFCKHMLLYWLEILCLDGKLRSAVLALDLAIKWIRDEASSAMLTNCYRYLVYYYNTISLGPCHIYLSTLPFVPRHNLSNSPWERELHSSPRVIMTDGNNRWDRVLFTLTSHSDDVNAVSYSPDGETIATGGDDRRVMIWDSRTGAQVHILEGHSSLVWAVAFSPNGRLLVSGSGDRSVRMWNSATGILIHTLERHSQQVRAVCFSPLGHMIASGSDDSSVILWDSGTGSFIRMLSGHSHLVLSIIFSPDGAQIVSCSENSSIIIWDTETGTVISRLQGSESGSTVYSLAFSPDGSQLASTCKGDVILWNYGSHRILRRLEGSIGNVRCVAFSPDGRFVVAGCESGQVVTWDITTGSQIGTFSGHTNQVVSVAVSPDGSRVVTGSYDDTAAVWDLSSGWQSDGGNDTPNQKSHKDAVRPVALAPDGIMSASQAGAEDNNVAGRHSLIHILKGHGKSVTTVAFSPDGRTLASGSTDDKSIIVWDTESGKSVKTLQLRREVQCLAFSPDGRYLVAACHRSKTIPGPTMLKMWIIEDSRPCQSSSPTVEEARQVLSGSPASGSPPSGIYLARDENSQWVEKRCQGNTIERLCHLPQHDITVSASFGRKFAYGTRRGTICVLDFPPETFGITATTMCTTSQDKLMFDFDFHSNFDPYSDSD